MRLRLLPLAAAVLLGPAVASAQLSNRSIAVESGLSAPLEGGADLGGALAISATTWVDGDLDLVARLSLGSAPGTGGRGAASRLAGTVGLRVAFGHAPLRTQLSVELGWARLTDEARTADRPAFGLGAGLEWFPVRDVALAWQAALRGAGRALALEGVLGAAAYF